MVSENEEIHTSITDKLQDNIWFQARFTKEFNSEYSIIKFDEVLFSNNDKKASLTISNHRPLWA
jgi:hypothetical protein